MLTVVEKVMALQNVDVFCEVSTEHLSHLAAVAEEVAFAAGRNVFAEADPADAMYMVLTGKVSLRRQGVDITAVGPGEAFGTWALFDEEPHLFTAAVVDDAQLLRIGRDDFVDLLSDHVQITQGVLRALARKLRGLVDRVGPAE